MRRRQGPAVNSRRLHGPPRQPRKGLTAAIVRPRQGRGALVSFRVRRFHLRLLTVSRFAGR